MKCVKLSLRTALIGLTVICFVMAWRADRDAPRLRYTGRDTDVVVVGPGFVVGNDRNSAALVALKSCSLELAPDGALMAVCGRHSVELRPRIVTISDLSSLQVRADGEVVEQIGADDQVSIGVLQLATLDRNAQASAGDALLVHVSGRTLMMRKAGTQEAGYLQSGWLITKPSPMSFAAELGPGHLIIIGLLLAILAAHRRRTTKQLAIESHQRSGGRGTGGSSGATGSPVRKQ